MHAKTAPPYPTLRWVWVDTISEPRKVHLAGYADLSCASMLASLEAALRDETEIEFHVADLEFFDTTFLRFLLRIRHDGERDVKLVGVTPRLKRVLEITGLSRLFV